MNIYFALNIDLYGYKAGTIIKTVADSNGVPLAKKWRKRFIDAPDDNCLTVFDKPSKNTKNNAVTG